MQLRSLKQLVATLALHVVRERVDAALYPDELAGWFGPLAEREATLRDDGAANVEAHMRELAASAKELPPPPHGVALVPELQRSCFECLTCAEKPCGDNNIRNAQNLVHAKRLCLQYVTAHFNELRRVTADLVTD